MTHQKGNNAAERLSEIKADFEQLWVKTAINSDSDA